MMKYKEFEIKEDNYGFQIENHHIDCKSAVKNDKELILQEAENSHKGELELYDKDSLRPKKVRVFFCDEYPVYAIIIYIIDYKDGGGRYACGCYYPVSNNERIQALIPHPYQGSICW